MKKLSKRNTYTPTDASQVSGNCDRILNKEATLSVSGLKTLDNRSEVNISEHRKQDLRVLVYVFDKQGMQQPFGSECLIMMQQLQGMQQPSAFY